jgi:hypothetical protein
MCRWFEWYLFQLSTPILGKNNLLVAFYIVLRLKTTISQLSSNGYHYNCLMLNIRKYLSCSLEKGGGGGQYDQRDIL